MNVVAAYPKEGLTDLLILFTHAYTTFLCISSQFTRSLLIVVITSLFACETFGLTIVLHLGRLREMCTFKSIIKWMLATEGNNIPYTRHLVVIIFFRPRATLLQINCILIQRPAPETV